MSTFTKLNETQTNVILVNFNPSCSNVDPAVSIPLKPYVKYFVHVTVLLLTDIRYIRRQISTALAGNIKNITADAIINLGNKVVGLKITQINLVLPSVLISGLSTLSTASGWTFGKAKAVINVLLREYKVKFLSPIEEISLKSS